MYRLKQFIIHYGESFLLPIIIIVSIMVGSPLLFCVAVILLFLLYLFVFVIFFKGPLRIETPDGYNQPYHPSVVFFENGWNGWKYWMAFTPFPVGGKPYMDRWENPCVVVSQDGIHWQYPDKKVFLDDLTAEQIKNRNYYSDTHLLYNRDEDSLQLYYRLNAGRNSDEVSIFRITTNNGISWTDKERLDSRECELYDPEPVSQAVIYQNHKYKMWYVADTKGESLREIRSMESDDGLIWNHISSIELSGKEINPWHIDCQFFDGRYFLLIYSFDSTLTLWKSEDGKCFSYVNQILKPSNRAGVFYNARLYRSCLINADNQWRVYFSAHNGKRHQLGLMTGKSMNDLWVVSCSGITKADMVLFLVQLASHLFTIEIKLISRLRRR